jgi:hypothetical protein
MNVIDTAKIIAARIRFLDRTPGASVAVAAASVDTPRQYFFARRRSTVSPS